MNKILVLIKSIRESLIHQNSKYHKYNELAKWVKANHKTDCFYLNLDEIGLLVEKIVTYCNIYPELDEVDVLENMKPYLNINEVKTLECNYRTDKAGPIPIDGVQIAIDENYNKNISKFWATYISLPTTIDGEDITFDVLLNGVVRKSDVQLYFEDIIGIQKEDLTLSKLYLLLKFEIKNCSYSDIYDCISLHYSDVVLKRKIWDAAKERMANNEKAIQKTYR